MKIIFKFILVSFLLTACGDLEDFFDARHDEASDFGDGSGGDGNSGLGGDGSNSGDGNGQDIVDFARIRRDVLEPNCINCHTGYHSSYSNYNLVKASASQMLERMTTQNNNRVMPKGRARLNPQTIALFESWIDAGAPEFVKVEDPDEPIVQPIEPKPEDKQIGFAQIRLEVLDANNCTSCHSQYKDYSVVRRSIGGILSAISNDWMPYPQREGGASTPVPPEARELLDKWVAQGLPEFSFKDAEPLEPVTIEPNWVSLRNNVIGPKCILCHNSYGARAPNPMDTYTALQAWFLKDSSLFDTDPTTTEHGKFMVTINQDPDDIFAFPSAMPFNNEFDDVLNDVPQVTEDEKRVIEAWIKAGLPHGN